MEAGDRTKVILNRRWIEAHQNALKAHYDEFRIQGEMTPSAPEPEQASRLARRFEEAVALHRNGELRHAELLYRQVLTEQPRHFGSLHLLGVIAAQRGDHAAALDHIDAALRLHANDA